jgi:hypothetical protein
MTFRVYNFDKIEKQSKNESLGPKLTIADYWQYYTTGVENLVNNNEYFRTDRLENERSEVITWKFFDDPGLSDIILALNNDVYLWDTPFDYELVEQITDNKMNYIKKMYKADMPEDVEQYWYDKTLRDTLEYQDILRSVVLPRYSDLQTVIRKIKEYFRDREVK